MFPSSNTCLFHFMSCRQSSKRELAEPISPINLIILVYIHSIFLSLIFIGKTTSHRSVNTDVTDSRSIANCLIRSYNVLKRMQSSETSMSINQLQTLQNDSFRTFVHKIPIKLTTLKNPPTIVYSASTSITSQYKIGDILDRDRTLTSMIAIQCSSCNIRRSPGKSCDPSGSIYTCH